MFEHELGDHPLGLRKESCLQGIRVLICLALLKLLTVMKMYLMGDV